MDEMILEKLIADVQTNRKYARITRELVHRLSQDALSRGLRGKAAVKEVRNKLHQVGGAYFKTIPNYPKAIHALSELPSSLDSDQIRQFCLKQMESHASTAERLPILESFFAACLEPITPVKSVLDLACGLNPLAIPWMPLKENFSYQACDIYLDMLILIEAFFTHCRIDGRTSGCDLAGGVPQERAQVALLLKSIPCLEQIDREIGLSLLKNIRADHILVSFPVRSLGGQKKGMSAFYREHFLKIVADTGWTIQEFEFSSELAFLVTK